MKKLQSQSEELLKLNGVIETATDAIITISARGEIESVNNATALLFGYKKIEMLGQNISMLMPQPHKGAHTMYLSRYLETRKTEIVGKGRNIEGCKKNGLIFPMRLSVSEVKLRDRVIFTGILYDLSQQKETEARIYELNRRLENRVKERTEELENAVSKLLEINRKLQTEIEERKIISQRLKEKEEAIRKTLDKEKELNALKSRFITMASHQFRTPLASIVSSAEIIGEYEKTEQQPKRERHIDRIRAAVVGLNAILYDFSSLGQLEDEAIEIKPAFFSISTFFEEEIEEWKTDLKAGQKIIYSKEESLQEIYFDKKALKLLVRHLVSNASKYSNENASIFCKTYLKEGDFCIEIKDEGIGIPDKEKKHLFSRFFRASNVENIQGTGLGLNIIKKYLNLVNGKIKFESIEGKGSVFTISIPYSAH